ncbi:E3 ubiquitin-protein ligase UBR3 [Porphyridium purpureum]|uniref:E3 ubiquitin-protein ligase n=1 Tax=Porphyridium purpureum TaxID=35688 RepID=A0A5J4YLT4_PORPP|nr:E3 ubiquitin-protein ligase UBR3 [Porphyridium purpureum]|eukprot:POR5730..scf249_10
MERRAPPPGAAPSRAGGLRRVGQRAAGGHGVVREGEGVDVGRSLSGVLHARKDDLVALVDALDDVDALCAVVDWDAASPAQRAAEVHVDALLENCDYAALAQCILDRKGGSERIASMLSACIGLRVRGEGTARLRAACGEDGARSGVCGLVWKKDELAYKCKTCERDPTCAICVSCFRHGDHAGHDFAMIRTGGGCCDCGDGQAWRKSGFCSRHRGASSEQDDPAVHIPPAVQQRIGVVSRVVIERIALLLAGAREKGKQRRIRADLSDASQLSASTVQVSISLLKWMQQLVGVGDGVCRLVGLQFVLQWRELMRALKFAPNAPPPENHVPCVLWRLLQLDGFARLPLPVSRELHALYYSLITDLVFKRAFLHMFVANYERYIYCLLQRRTSTSSATNGSTGRDNTTTHAARTTRQAQAEERDDNQDARAVATDNEQTDGEDSEMGAREDDVGFEIQTSAEPRRVETEVSQSDDRVTSVGEVAQLDLAPRGSSSGANAEEETRMEFATAPAASAGRGTDGDLSAGLDVHQRHPLHERETDVEQVADGTGLNSLSGRRVVDRSASPDAQTLPVPSRTLGSSLRRGAPDRGGMGSDGIAHRSLELESDVESDDGGSNEDMDEDEGEEQNSRDGDREVHDTDDGDELDVVHAIMLMDEMDELNAAQNGAFVQPRVVDMDFGMGLIAPDEDDDTGMVMAADTDGDDNNGDDGDSASRAGDLVDIFTVQLFTVPALVPVMIERNGLTDVLLDVLYVLLWRVSSPIHQAGTPAAATGATRGTEAAVPRSAAVSVSSPTGANAQEGPRKKLCSFQKDYNFSFQNREQQSYDLQTLSEKEQAWFRHQHPLLYEAQMQGANVPPTPDGAELAAQSLRVVDLGKQEVSKQEVIDSVCWRVIYDLRYVLTHVEAAAHVMHARRHVLLRKFVRVLRLLQGMNAVRREMVTHVEQETDHWALAFTLELEMHQLVDLLMAGFLHPHADKSASLAAIGIVRAELDSWLRADAARERAQFAVWLLREFKVSCDPVSLHLPLHRFLALLASELLHVHRVPLRQALGFVDEGRGRHDWMVSALMLCDHVIRVQVFMAQVHAGMWRRNGRPVVGQAILYRSVFCVEWLVDLDIFLIQACAQLVSHAEFEAFVVKRFGLTDMIRNMRALVRSERRGANVHDLYGEGDALMTESAESAHALASRSLLVDASERNHSDESHVGPAEGHASETQGPNLGVACIARNEYEPVLLEDLLLLFIYIACERSRSGMTSEQNLRYKFLQKLAIADQTHSQLVRVVPRRFASASHVQQQRRHSVLHGSASSQSGEIALELELERADSVNSASANFGSRRQSQSTVFSNSSRANSQSLAQDDVDTNGVVERLLDELASFSHPREMEQGCYVLKDSSWDDFDPFASQYSHRERAAAEERFLAFRKRHQNKDESSSGARNANRVAMVPSRNFAMRPCYPELQGLQLLPSALCMTSAPPLTNHSGTTAARNLGLVPAILAACVKIAESSTAGRIGQNTESSPFGQHADAAHGAGAGTDADAHLPPPHVVHQTHPADDSDEAIVERIRHRRSRPTPAVVLGAATLDFDTAMHLSLCLLSMSLECENSLLEEGRTNVDDIERRLRRILLHEQNDGWHVLELIERLHRMDSLRHDEEVGAYLNRILDTLNALQEHDLMSDLREALAHVPAYGALCAARQRSAQEEQQHAGQLREQARRLEAQKRKEQAMARIKAQQDAFVRKIKMDEDNEFGLDNTNGTEEEEDDDEDGDPIVDSDLVCALCRDGPRSGTGSSGSASNSAAAVKGSACESDTSQDIGYIGFAQRSNLGVLARRSTKQRSAFVQPFGGDDGASYVYPGSEHSPSGVSTVGLDAAAETPSASFGSLGDFRGLSRLALGGMQSEEEVLTSGSVRTPIQGQGSSEADPEGEVSHESLKYCLTNGLDDAAGIYIGFCGHCMHRSCFESYFSSLLMSQLRRIPIPGDDMLAAQLLLTGVGADGDGIARWHRGEFLCPVCRRLANVIMPVVGRDKSDKSRSNMDPWPRGAHAAAALAARSVSDTDETERSSARDRTFGSPEAFHSWLVELDHRHAHHLRSSEGENGAEGLGSTDPVSRRGGQLGAMHSARQGKVDSGSVASASSDFHEDDDEQARIAVDEHGMDVEPAHMNGARGTMGDGNVNSDTPMTGPVVNQNVETMNVANSAFNFTPNALFAQLSGIAGTMRFVLESLESVMTLPWRRQDASLGHDNVASPHGVRNQNQLRNNTPVMQGVRVNPMRGGQHHSASLWSVTGAAALRLPFGADQNASHLREPNDSDDVSASAAASVERLFMSCAYTMLALEIQARLEPLSGAQQRQIVGPLHMMFLSCRAHARSDDAFGRSSSGAKTDSVDLPVIFSKIVARARRASNRSQTRSGVDPFVLLFAMLVAWPRAMHLTSIMYCVRFAYFVAVAQSPGRLHAEDRSGHVDEDSDRVNVAYGTLLFLRRAAILLAVVLQNSAIALDHVCLTTALELEMDEDQGAALYRSGMMPNAWLAKGQNGSLIGSRINLDMLVQQAESLRRALMLPLVNVRSAVQIVGYRESSNRGQLELGPHVREPALLPLPLRLIRLPRLFQDLLECFHTQKCFDCGRLPQMPALCLVCGVLICALGACNNASTLARPNANGSCARHAEQCGAGTGVFLILKLTSVLILREDRRAHWGSPYLDDHGEEDIELRRGKPLILSKARYKFLQSLWLSSAFDSNSLVLAQTVRLGETADLT